MNASDSLIANSNNTTAYFNNNTIDDHNIDGNLRIYQLNIEGISERKCEYLAKELLELNIDVAAIQETHLEGEGKRSTVKGFTMVSSVHHKKFGLATYVKDDLLPSVQVLTPENSLYSAIKINDQTLVNVYKPPSADFGNEVLPHFEKPSIICGDFNSHNPLWGYDDTNNDGLKVADWMTREDLSLIFNVGDPGTFKSGRWNRSYTPDLCFVSKDSDGNAITATRRILRGFPNSQHRPIIIDVGLKLPLIRADERNRWNFGKADWEKFSQTIESTILRIPANASNYHRFVGLVISSAKQSIPRGHRNVIIPGWSKESQELFDSFQETGNVETGKQLLKELDQNRKLEWETKVESMSFTRSSKKAWNLINRLSGKSFKSKKIYPVSPNQIASQMISNSKGVVSASQKRLVNQRYMSNFRNSRHTSTFAAPFSMEEVLEAIAEIECGKAPGQDNIFNDYLKHLGPRALKWLGKLFTNIYLSGRTPKEWKLAKVIAFLKPNKPADDPANYRPISLLSCCFKLFERAILTRIRDVLETAIPKTQAGFQRNRNCCDQVLALTNFIELGFQKGMKTGVVFVDLSAAYDTVWKRGLLLKLSVIIPCRKTLTLMMNMLSDRCIQVEINGKNSSKRILNNGLPQGSVLSCFLYCLYTSDIPNTRSRLFMYADDIAIAFQAKTFEEIERALRADLVRLSFYFSKWRLKPNAGKTVSCVFHLNNRAANRKLRIKFNGMKVKHDKHPKYLGVFLDRSLTYRPQLTSTQKKLKPRINIVQKLAGSSWGCSAKTLRITTQALVMSIADYCSPVWMNSCHVKLVDTQVNVAMRLISGSVQSTELEWLNVLSNIAPIHLLRQESALRECEKIKMNNELPIHGDIESAPNTLRLRSRKPFWCFYRDSTNMDNLMNRWRCWWQNVSVHNKQLITDPTLEVNGIELPRRTWLRLNRVRTGQGCVAFLLHRWNIIESPLCQCGEDQTMEHFVQLCPIHRFEGDIHEIHDVSDRARIWLENLAVNI